MRRKRNSFQSETTVNPLCLTNLVFFFWIHSLLIGSCISRINFYLHFNNAINHARVSKLQDCGRLLSFSTNENVFDLKMLLHRQTLLGVVSFFIGKLTYDSRLHLTSSDFQPTSLFRLQQWRFPLSSTGPKAASRALCGVLVPGTESVQPTRGWRPRLFRFCQGDGVFAPERNRRAVT